MKPKELLELICGLIGITLMLLFIAGVSAGMIYLVIHFWYIFLPTIALFYLLPVLVWASFLLYEKWEKKQEAKSIKKTCCKLKEKGLI